jgi:hypothetical protein
MTASYLLQGLLNKMLDDRVKTKEKQWGKRKEHPKKEKEKKKEGYNAEPTVPAPVTTHDLS